MCVSSHKETWAEIGKNVAWVPDFYQKYTIIPQYCELLSVKADEWWKKNPIIFCSPRLLVGKEKWSLGLPYQILSFPRYLLIFWVHWLDWDLEKRSDSIALSHCGFLKGPIVPTTCILVASCHNGRSYLLRQAIFACLSQAHGSGLL